MPYIHLESLCLMMFEINRSEKVRNTTLRELTSYQMLAEVNNRLENRWDI